MIGRAFSLLLCVGTLSACPANAEVVPLPSANDVVLVGAGDISSCDNDMDELTARFVERVLASASPASSAFTLGDNVYPDGSPELFRNCYDPTWGRFRKRTLPVIGNHDWRTTNAAGFLNYFGLSKTWGSSDVTPAAGMPWHVVRLDSDCDKVDCGAEARWLEADLKASKAVCTVVLMHHPLVSSGPHGSSPEVRPMWRIMQDADVDLVLAGHDHTYERFTHLDASGNPDALGPRLFIVGTGGKSHYVLTSTANGSEKRVAGRDGAFVLYLGATDYRWEFRDVSGAIVDAGSDTCRSAQFIDAD